jgi:hypothetical protein
MDTPKLKSGVLHGSSQDIRLRSHHGRRLDADVVNYAGDLVICCRPGNGATALATMRRLMEKLGLTVNDRKTRRSPLRAGAQSTATRFQQDNRVKIVMDYTVACTSIAYTGQQSET